MTWGKEGVTKVRRRRAENQVPPKARLPRRIEGRGAAAAAVIAAQAALIAALANVDPAAAPVPAGAGRGHVATPEFDLLLDLPSADVGAERERLDMDSADVAAEVTTTTGPDLLTQDRPGLPGSDRGSNAPRQPDGVTPQPKE